jgi:hypothetical protein
VVKNIQQPDRPSAFPSKLLPPRDRDEDKPEPVQLAPQKLCACTKCTGCPNKIRPSSRTGVCSKCQQGSCGVTRNRKATGRAFLQPVDAETWNQRYGRRRQGDPMMLQVIDELEKAPLDFQGELTLPPHRSVRGMRSGIERHFRRQGKVRIRFIASPKNPRCFGVVKESRTKERP